MNNAGDFAARRRGLPGRANGIVDCDGNSCFLLADGATNEGVTQGHYDSKKQTKHDQTKMVCKIIKKE